MAHYDDEDSTSNEDRCTSSEESKSYSCSDCGRDFETENSLIHHKLTHRAPHHKCFGCDRTFTTYGGMILHLEAGTCASQLDANDILYSASICFQWKQYFAYVDDRAIIAECQSQGLDVYEYLESPVFECPTCESTFGKLSGLFMHVESPACGQTLEGGAIGKLRRWLWKRHA